MEDIAGKYHVIEAVQSRRDELMEVATEWFWATERFAIQRTEFAKLIKIVRMSACRFKKLKRRWRL